MTATSTNIRVLRGHLHKVIPERVRLLLQERLHSSYRILVKEIAAFGLIGIAALVIDLTLFNLLLHHGALKAKCISTIVSTTFAYVGNRYWSFSHRARTNLGRETVAFFGINLITLIGSELLLALFAYPFGQRHDHLVMNIVNIGTIGLGTIFRFWTYKRFVFLHPDKVHAGHVDLDVELTE